MDTQPTQNEKLAQVPPRLVPRGAFPAHAVSNGGAGAAPTPARETLRFPGEDGGKSLSEMAQRDLDATLQLLTERAQYISGASGAAIALRDGENMVCCASSGDSAPHLGAHLQIDSGLSAESVRTRKVLHCEDAENDPRVNRESCKAFGISSVVVMPLVRGEEVFGVFELLADRPRAFEERDFVALQRLSEMIKTAVDHADAARRAEKEFGIGPDEATATEMRPEANSSHAALITAVLHDSTTAQKSPPLDLLAKEQNILVIEENSTPISEAIPVLDAVAEAAETADGDLADSELIATDLPDVDLGNPIIPMTMGKVRSCQACGFPISDGRRLCLDCEAATPNMESTGPYQPLAELPGVQPSWVRSNLYLVATVVIVVATFALLVWRL